MDQHDQPVPLPIGPTAGVQIIDRSVVNDVTRRDMAEWPDDVRAQRAWCLDRSLAAFGRSGDAIPLAAKLLDYINTGAVPADIAIQDV